MSRLACHRCKTWIPQDEDFDIHHVGHIQWPVVTLNRLSEHVLLEIEKNGSYLLAPDPKVSPIKIAVRKNGACSEFFVSSQASGVEKMQGLNGISIQRKNGQNCSMPLVPREEAQTRNDNPLELLQKLSGCGIMIDRRPGKANESDNRKEGDLNTETSKEVSSETNVENKNSDSENLPPSADSLDTSLPIDPEDAVIGETGIDILKKMLSSVPAKSIEGDDDVIIENEIPRSTVTNDNTVTEQSQNEPDGDFRNSNTGPAVAQRSAGAAVPEEQAPAETFPHAEIRVANNLGQNPDFWNGASSQQPQQDPLMTSNDCQNFLHSLIDNSMQPHPPEFLTLEQLDPGMQKQATKIQHCMPGQMPRTMRPAQISVIPQRQMQVSRPQRMIAPANQPPPQQHPCGVRVRAPPPPPPYEIHQPQPPEFHPGYPPYPNYPPNQHRPPQLQPPPLSIIQRRIRAPRAPRPQIQARSFESMAAPRMAVKRGTRMPAPRNSPAKIRRTGPGAPAPNSTSTPPTPAAQAANALAMRGITVTSNRQQQQQQQQKSPGTSSNSQRTSVPITNHDVPRPEPCATVDLTADEVSFPCNICGKEFTNSANLEAHKALHQRSASSSFKCDKCSASFYSSTSLNMHKSNAHGSRLGNELAIPVVNLALPATQMLLSRAGITSYIPLSQLQTGQGMQYALPIINVETNGKVVSSSLDSLGATNVLLLGKLTPLQKK